MNIKMLRLIRKASKAVPKFTEKDLVSYYNNLDDSEKPNFKALLQTIVNHKDEIAS